MLRLTAAFVFASIFSASAGATVIPSAGTSFTDIDWSNQPESGDNTFITSLGDVYAGAAGGLYGPQYSSTWDQLALFGQDNLVVSFEGFSVHQILFNFTAGNVPSEVTISGVQGAFSIPDGDSYFEYFSKTPITDFELRAIGFGVDNVFQIGSVFVSDSSQSLDGLAFNIPDLPSPVPEPGTLGLLVAGLGIAALLRVGLNRSLRTVSAA